MRPFGSQTPTMIEVVKADLSRPDLCNVMTHQLWGKKVIDEPAKDGKVTKGEQAEIKMISKIRERGILKETDHQIMVLFDV